MPENNRIRIESFFNRKSLEVVEFPIPNGAQFVAPAPVYLPIPQDRVYFIHEFIQFPIIVTTGAGSPRAANGWDAYCNEFCAYVDTMIVAGTVIPGVGTVGVPYTIVPIITELNLLIQNGQRIGITHINYCGQTIEFKLGVKLVELNANILQFFTPVEITEYCKKIT